MNDVDLGTFVQIWVDKNIFKVSVKTSVLMDVRGVSTALTILKARLERSVSVLWRDVNLKPYVVVIENMVLLLYVAI